VQEPLARRMLPRVDRREIAAIFSGVTIAAPTPWTARAAISTPMLGASADAALAAVNTVCR
jgi:hypothetical protein